MRRLAGAAVTVAAIAAPVMAAPLVVHAAGPSAAAYHAGQKLAADAVLALKAGDEVTVLAAAGTRRYVGPGSFALADAPPSAAFDQLLEQRAERRPRSGALPDPAGARQPPGVWALDVAASGTVCALDRRAISLWRIDAAAPQALTVMRRGVPTAVSFGAGQATATLPRAVGARDGDVLTITGLAHPVTLTLRLLPSPKSLEALGEALVNAGCQGQFDRLADATRLPDTP